jgi:hypothetical protein
MGLSRRSVADPGLPNVENFPYEAMCNFQSGKLATLLISLGLHFPLGCAIGFSYAVVSEQVVVAGVLYAPQIGFCIRVRLGGVL